MRNSWGEAHEKDRVPRGGLTVLPLFFPMTFVDLDDGLCREKGAFSLSNVSACY